MYSNTQNSYVDTLTPNVTAFEDRVFRELVKVNGVMGWGGTNLMTGDFIRRR